MSTVIEGGLYIVFKWIDQRRRETNEYIRQYADNMMKSFAIVYRRIRMNRGAVFGDVTSPVPFAIRRHLYGVPGKTRRRRWFKHPDHEYAAHLYNHWIQNILTHRTRVDNPDGGGSPIITRTPYYLPGL